MYHIYSDGACSRNKVGEGIGGYGAVIIDKDEKIYEISGSQENTTNNRMELYSSIMGLKKLSNILDDDTKKINCTVFSDSKYLVDGWNNYLFTWVDHGWRRSNRRKVLNVDLWKSLYFISCNFKKVKFTWIKGHANNKFNERADKIAKASIIKLKKRAA